MAQTPFESQQILEVQNKQQQFEIPMQTPLQQFTNQIYQQLQNLQLTLHRMSLQDLKKYHYGLSVYKSDMVATQNVVMGEIKRKEAKKRKAEKAANWWVAMGIIFVCLSGIITGAYSPIQIQQIQTGYLK